MSSVFDRLQEQLDIKKRDQGISALEIAELPPLLRKIMRLMLREVVWKYSDIYEATQAMPEDSRLDREELDYSLETLVKNNWLQKFGEGEYTSYRVNLRRKAGSQLGSDIWTTLSEKIYSGKQEHPPDNE